MCGRFVASRPVGDIADLLEVEDVEIPEELTAPRWNVAPTDPVLAVNIRGRRDDPVPRRRLTDYRWGLVPSWAKSPDVGIKAFNARAESLVERPAFRTALARRRCIIPADAFYEWEKIRDTPGGRVVRRQPWCFAAADGGILAFAGLWEAWKANAPAAGQRPEPQHEGSGWHGDWLLSCTIITTEANDVVAPLHDRMPVVLQREDWATWLEPRELEGEEFHALLRPAAGGVLRSFPVSSAVNNTASDGPELVAPIPETVADRPTSGPG